MHFKEALGIALQSMRAARLRTALTTLGIVVGVAAVIVLVGLGTGIQTGFNQQFSSLNTSIVVMKTQTSLPGANPSLPITEDDLAALADPKNAPSISDVTPLRNGIAVLRYGEREFRASVAGSYPAYLTIRNRTLTAGRMFTDQDNETRERVIVIGPKILTTLFDGDVAQALRSEIRVGRLSMKVIGILKPAGDDQDGTAIVPLNSARALFAGANNLNGVGLMANSVEQVPVAITEIQRVLDERHRVVSPDLRDYSVTAPLIQLERMNKFISMLTIFVAIVAGIALLVGAAGIANIMLVTVNERTGEIGVRKAVGARNSAIMKQFLTESTLLAGLGGLGGVALGIGMIYLGVWLMPRVAPEFGPPQVSWSAVGIAFGASLLIGLLAGGLPARRAANLHPIQALRQ